MVSVEQRFKNYIDEKYHLYDNADEDFFKRLVNERENNKDWHVFEGMQDKRRRIVEERVNAQIEGRKPIDD